MAEIRIDADKAERMIAQIIGDNGGLLPAKANTLAADICRRLSTAIQMAPSLHTFRIISREPPYASDFAVAVANTLAEAKGEPLVPEDLWRLVYDRGRDLPVPLP